MTHQVVGFIGLGNMGAGMARNLIKSVDTMYVHDQRAESMHAMQQVGAIVCESPREVAQHCDLIFLCLPFAPEVRSTVFGPEGIQSANKSGLTVVDTTTLDRTDAIDIGTALAEAGIQYWDCPVSGLPKRADNGTLTLMFGGPESGFNQVKPCLDSFGEAIYCGELGCGQAMKAINNIIYNINIVALCEVLPLAVAVGLKPEQLAQLVTTGSSRSFASEHFVPKMIEGQFNGDFALRDAYKDIVNVQKMGVETRASLPVVNAMISSYQAAIAAGYESEPKSAMLKVYESSLGVQFRKSVSSD